MNNYNMKTITAKQRTMLRDAQDYCIEEDKSVVFMIQYMMDYAGCSHSQVMEYLEAESKRLPPQQNGTGSHGRKTR